MVCWMRSRPAPWRKALTAWMLAAAVVALMVDVRPAMPQTPFDLYRERIAMAAAGARCGLFDADVAAALAAGVDQARTAALRVGYRNDALDHGAADARGQVARMPCSSARLQQAALQAKAAFRAYGALRRMSFPGQTRAWRADKIMPRESSAWRLAQDGWAGEDKVVFGVAGLRGAETLTLAVASDDGASPYAARLLLRDKDRLPEPLLQPGAAPLAARAPARAAAKVILAEGMAPADPALRPKGSDRAVAFSFPASALKAFEQLDPREAVSVEILYPSDRREMVRTAFVEVGDFDAGEAFLKTER